MNQNHDTINRLLRTASAEGAYALGLVSGWAEKDDFVASDAILEAAVLCVSVEEVVDLYNQCVSFSPGSRTDLKGG